jgi:uncharacterized repeat protein (TIGR01451 family)
MDLHKRRRPGTRLAGLLGSALIASLAIMSLASAVSAAETVAIRTGTIKICKVIVDPSNHVITGSEASGGSFTIPSLSTSAYGPAAGSIGDVTFNTTLSVTDNIGTNQVSASCKTFTGLKIGHYYYGQEIVTQPGTGSFTLVGYNDGFDPGRAFNSAADFLPYNDCLFSPGTDTGCTRDLNADGDIALTLDRPDRILVIVNRYTAPEGPPPTSQTPLIGITKTPSATSVVAGTEVTYTYNVTNLGTMFLTGVTVTDNTCSPVSYVSGDNGDGILQPGETWKYTCTATVNVTTTNTGTATGWFGNNTTSAQAQATVTVTTPPATPATTTPTSTPTPTPTPTGKVKAVTGTPKATLPPTSTIDGQGPSNPGGNLGLILLSLTGLIAVLGFTTPLPARIRRRNRRS